MSAQVLFECIKRVSESASATSCGRAFQAYSDYSSVVKFEINIKVSTINDQQQRSEHSDREKKKQEGHAVAGNHRAMRGTCTKILYLILRQCSE